MKSSTLAIGSLIAVAIAAILCNAARESKLWRLLFPPHDLFDIVLQDGIDISSPAQFSVGHFTLKYNGPYICGLLLDKFSSSSYQNNIDLKLRLKIEFFHGADLIAFKSTSNTYTPFLGLRGNGLSLVDFNAPHDVPLNSQIFCKVSVISPDIELSTVYGPVTFYIQKMSEK